MSDNHTMLDDVYNHYNHYKPSSRLEKKEQTNDPVNHPKHYQLLPGVEVIDVRKAIFSEMPDGVSYFAVDCYSRTWEYLTRMWGKNKLEDAKKARVYLNWLIDELEKDT